MSAVSMRPATPEDGRFVADSWIRSYKGAYRNKRVPAEVYWKRQREVVANLVDRSDVWVACDPLNPWTVWGWICAERQANVLVVHYVYVKNPFRGFKVGSMLVKELVEERPTDAVFYTADTKSAKHFLLGLRENGALPTGVEPVYDPFLQHVS